MNNLNLIGRVGQSPVLTTFADTNNQLAKFSLAVPDYFSKTDDPEPMWIDVESWNGLAERVMKYVTEGREIGINGRLSISKYKKEINGVEVEIKRPVVKLTSFHLCGKKPKSEEQDGEVAAYVQEAQDCGIAWVAGRKPRLAFFCESVQ